MEHLRAQDINCTLVLQKTGWHGEDFIHQIQNNDNSPVLVKLSRIKKVWKIFLLAE
jgi:hypothetical protein